MPSTNNFTLIKASAGSGKTFQLVLHYLTYALRTENPGNYKHILAITFTNAAAAEMKHRVLSNLRVIADGSDKSPMSSELQSALKLSPEALRLRASAAYTHMLHHYGQLSILTIDSFTHRLVRSFARDLQLNNDFNIELNPQTLQEKAVDRMLEFIGQDELLTSYLHKYSSDLLEDGQTWNPREALVSMAKEIFSESGLSPLKKFEDIDLLHIQQEHRHLRSQLKNYETEVKTTAKAVLELLERAALTKEHLAGKSTGIISAFKKYTENAINVAVPKSLEKLKSEGKWLHSSATAEVKTRFEGIRKEAHALADKLFDLLSEESLHRISLIKKISDNVYTLGLIDRINEYAGEIRTEENMVLLSDFHRMINAIIRGNDAPFIFERIGARYKHILVDEFQDTSKMQWMNLVPLIHNCLSEGHENLIVGDAKQSIYRWRSGYVEQFISLPKLPAEFEMPQAQSMFENSIRSIALQTNYRSSHSVIHFNNTIFPILSAKFPEYKGVYDEVKQEVKKDTVGYVRLCCNPNKDEKGTAFVEKEIIKSITECVAAGFSPGDITILVRSHSQGTTCTKFLLEHNIKYTTAESALLIHSATVRIVMGYLEFHLFPQHRFAAFDVVQSLAALNKNVSLSAFINEQLNFKEYRAIELNQFLSKTFGDLSKIMIGENVFHKAVALIRTLELPIDNSVEYLLELIKQHCIGKNNDLHRFLEWWKENLHKLSASAANNPDAVQIMTIHKSKGLEFPVVIIPHFKETPKSSHLWIDVPEEICALPAAYIKVNANKEGDNEEGEEDLLAPEISLEKKRRNLDELNNLYVSCTRAADRMYFIQEQGGVAFNKLLDSTFLEVFPEYKSTGTIEIGKQERYSGNKKTTKPIHIPALCGKEMLLPRMKLRSQLQRDTPEIRYGKLLHECFSLISTKTQAIEAVDKVLKAMPEGAIYRERLLGDLENVISNPMASQWYESDAKVICEQEMIASNGDTLRPDRVIIFENRVVVVDYKSGKESKHHANQVNAYKRELENIYKLPVEGYLLYTGGPTILPV